MAGVLRSANPTGTAGGASVPWGAMTDPLRIDDDETHLPVWLWLVIGVLVVLGALTVVRWVLGALAGLIGLAIVAAIVVGAFVIVRGAWRARR